MVKIKEVALGHCHHARSLVSASTFQELIMTLRVLPLATIAALLSLAGCATQQPGADPAEAANQRLSGLESRLQAEASSNQGLIGALGKKVEALSDELHHLQTTVAGQSSSSATAQQALAARLENLASESHATSAQVAGIQAALPALREQAHATGQQLERLAAQFNTQLMDNTLEQQAETEALAERMEATDSQLEEMAGQVSEALTQTGAVQAALPTLNGKVGEAGPRLDAYAARLAALDKRLGQVERMAQDALDATGLGQRKIHGKVIESITLTEDKTLFPLNSPDLGAQDKAKLDALALRLKTLGTNYHLQIQGHTDGFGADDYNYELGRARAEVVKNYLNENGIPLLRMSVMSYGSLEATRYAGQSNRRIVVQVLQ